MLNYIFLTINQKKGGGGLMLCGKSQGGTWKDKFLKIQYNFGTVNENLDKFSRLISMT